MRVGLIGYGGWTRPAYVPALQRDGRARIVSVAARSAASRERATAELGADVAVFAGPEELLAGPPVDAVMIAVPDKLHERALGAALAAGVPVLYEPPVAPTRRGIPPMLTRLLAAPQVTQADLELGFTPVVLRAAELVRGGAIGSPQTAEARLHASWGTNPEADLSTVGHLAPWYVDPLNRILDSTPRRILVLDGQGEPGRGQLHTLALLDYDGVRGAFQANIGSVSDVETQIEISGSDGDLVLDYFAGDLRRRSRANTDWSVERVLPLEPVAGWPGIHEGVAGFLDAVAGDGASLADARTVARLHLVGLAAEASKDAGAWVEIEGIETVQ